ncbi:MAG: hypothetical protein AAFW68_01225 [Pseudomonadota bacterium]
MSGKGLSLLGLAIGLMTGLAAYGIVEYWIDGRDDNAAAFTVLFFIVTMAASYLLLSEAGALFKAVAGALLIALIFALPDFFIVSALSGDATNLSPFPGLFWIMTRGLAAYLLTVLVKAAIEGGIPFGYTRVFFHGVTMPLIIAGAILFAGLALVLLFTWARLLKDLDVSFFNALFQKPWFLLPFIGAVSGLSIAVMRSQQAALGALRFVVLLLARILMLITAVFTVTLLTVFAINGVDVVFERPYPGATMIALAIAGMLIFNGVYQNGDGPPPPLWLRIPTLITLIGFPVYALLAFHAFSLRIDAYGLTPPRIAGTAVTGLVAAYSIVCIAGLLTELNWRAKRWMPMVGPLNIVMAALWIAVLIAIATPFANPWAISARSQYALLAGERIAVSDFDFAYLRFSLGDHGERTLDRLEALETHPEIVEIRKSIAHVRSVKSAWAYRNPALLNGETPLAPDDQEIDGPQSLPLNPDGVDVAPDDREPETL